MNELSDVELNKLADAGETYLRERGLERLLGDILIQPPLPYDWEAENDEHPPWPDCEGGPL